MLCSVRCRLCAHWCSSLFHSSVAKKRQANEYDLISADGEIDLRYFSTTKAQPVAGIVIAPNANIAIVKKEAFQ
jgi:hypothetical protein